MTDTEPKRTDKLDSQTKIENQDYLKEISEITGAPISDIRTEELQSVYRNNFARGKIRTDSPYKAKYLNLFSSSDRFYQLVEALTDLPANVMSYGLFMQDYSRMMEQHRRQNESYGPQISLLLGAQTTATIQEYSKTVEKILPNTKCHVIDIEKRDVGNSSADFEIANALELPDNLTDRFDIVQTNALIENLRKSRDRWDIDGNRITLLKNAHKVLHHGGALIMVDSTMNNEGRSDPEGFKKSLLELGYKDIEIQPAKQFLHRRDMDRAILSTENTTDAPLKDSRLFAIYALKK